MSLGRRRKDNDGNVVSEVAQYTSTQKALRVRIKLALERLFVNSVRVGVDDYEHDGS